jgi:hypothetical protein
VWSRQGKPGAIRLAQMKSDFFKKCSEGRRSKVKAAFFVKVEVACVKSPKP